MPLVPFVASLAMAASLAVGSPATNVQSQSHINIQSKPTPKPPPSMVTVNPGDTLDGIATSHQTSYIRLFDANTNITDPNLIFPGETLRIPDPNEQLTDRPLPADATPADTGSTAPVTQTQSSVPITAPPIVQSAPITGCGDNFYANYIYTHESGCRTTAMSPNGCYGIGQACPASKIAYCGADYVCQNAYFSAYAGKYGGWAGAYAFWVSHGWW